MTIEEMTKICKSACFCYDMTFDLKIELNARLTRTLGRVKLAAMPDGTWVPTQFEISKKAFEEATADSLRDIVLHECAHYIATKRTGQNHGHDEYFKNICRRIGTSAENTTIKATFKKEDNIGKPAHKYSIFCKTCNKEIGNRDKMCPVLRDIDNCYCKKCGQYNLYYTQNW